MSIVGQDESKKSRIEITRALPKRLYNVREAAVYLGRTTWAVRGMIAAGKIPYVRDGRRILLDIRDMDVWIEKSKAQIIE